MGIEDLYRKPNTSRKLPRRPAYPYLLRGLEIDRANQIWAVDVKYIPMTRGFVHLTAVIRVVGATVDKPAPEFLPRGQATHPNRFSVRMTGATSSRKFKYKTPIDANVIGDRSRTNLEEQDRRSTEGKAAHLGRLHTCGILVPGGDGRIRTVDASFCPHAPLAGECLRPLGHVSGISRARWRPVRQRGATTGQCRD